MRLAFLVSSLVALAAQAVILANSDTNETKTPHITFNSQIQADMSLRYVTNSGVCETTPGVNQYSGYIEVGKNTWMWFWFFESRNSLDTAPITLWLSGGPGCSSMYGLFAENGPCMVNEDRKTTYINPYSWNNVSNMLYFDQPTGTGFSYGTDTANSTWTAAPFVWKALQILFESQVFSKYATPEFILATQSYGGHYVPAFVTYFHEQNTLIARGEIEGECIIVSAIMINSGLIDPLISWKSLYDFARNAPEYGQLQPDDVLKKISDALYGPNGCVEQTKNCYAAGYSPESNDICFNASDYCIPNVLTPAIEGRNKYDLRQRDPPFFPPEYFMDYLNIPEVAKKIGAEVHFSICSEWDVLDELENTGDYARTFLPELSKLADTGLNILIWAGKTDIIFNWLGCYATVLAMDWHGKEALNNTPLSNITLHGKPVGAVVNVDNFSFASINDAGNELPAYQPELALEIFKQVINKEPIHSV